MATIEGENKIGGKSLLFKVKEFYEKHAEEFGLELVAGEEGIAKSIKYPEIERPGLSLAGFLKGTSRILIFGKAEMQFLTALSGQKRCLLLKKILVPKIPFILISRRQRPCLEMIEECDEKNIPLLRSSLPTMPLMGALFVLLTEACAPSLSCHGCLVEIFGIGVLIQGDAAIGKSEAALGLIQRGHRLISDDIVKVRRCQGLKLEGQGVDTSRHQMEIKGIGIVNIASLYGPASVREKKSLDIVVKLEVWNDSHFYDRNELKEKSISLLGVEMPFYTLQVKPGRNVVPLLETIALTHRLKTLSLLNEKGAGARGTFN